MTDCRRSSNRKRGAFFGLALLAYSGAMADEWLRDAVHRIYGHTSYVLIEAPGVPPQLLLLSSARSNVAQAAGTSTMFDEALLALGDPDPEIREEAVLTLADLGADAALLVAAMSDPSPAVRDAAAAVLEDMDEG